MKPAKVMMIQEYQNKTHTEIMPTNASKISKSKKHPLIYNNCRNSTGMHFKKKRSSPTTQFMTAFPNSDLRSTSVPFDAAKSSENINQGPMRINHEKRASTTEKFGPRKKKLPTIADSTNSGGIQTLEYPEEFPEGIVSEMPKSNGFISRNNNKTQSLGPLSNEKNLQLLYGSGQALKQKKFIIGESTNKRV